MNPITDITYERHSCQRGPHLFFCRRSGPFIAACFLLWVALARSAHGTTLQELVNGAFLNVGNSRFTDWQLISLDDTAPPNPDLTQIVVSPLAGDPANPGLQFVGNGQLSVAGINAIDAVVKFRVHALAGGNSFTGHTLSLTGVTFNSDGGTVYVSDELTNHLGADLGPTLVISDNESDVFEFEDSSSFPPQSGVWVTTNIFITGFSVADSIILNTVTQRFSQTGPAVLAGDYNQNGTVDAADYALWRNSVSAPGGTLPNDVDGGMIGQAQYATWRANFGRTSPALGSILSAAVPEPSTLALLLLTVPAIYGARPARRAPREAWSCVPANTSRARRLPQPIPRRAVLTP